MYSNNQKKTQKKEKNQIAAALVLLYTYYLLLLFTDVDVAVKMNSRCQKKVKKTRKIESFPV